MAFKNKDTGKWTAQWYEIDIYGKRRQMKKRGFTTCREAKAFERQKKLQTKGNLDMTLCAFAECYFQDKENELKKRTIKNKKYVMEQHVFPYFGHLKMNEITTQQIIQWQNKIRKASISSYSMQVNGWVDVSNRERFPCSWELQGSVNGNDWVTVDSRTDAFSSVDELKTWQYYTFTCQNPGYYSYYRIYVTGVVNRNESNYVYIGQIKAYGQFEYGESNETPPESSSKPYGYRLKMSHYDLEPVWKREFIQDDLTATGKARTWTCTDDSSVKLMYTEDFGGWTQVSTSAEGELVPDRTGFGTGDDPYPCFDEMGVAEITVIE